MSAFTTRYPDYAAIEKQVQRAHAQRALYLGNLFADGIIATLEATRRLFGAGPKAGPKPLVARARTA